MTTHANWDAFVGQTQLKERLQTHITSAIRRISRLDHILLIGTPGCGKTTLARLIAEEANNEFDSFIMPLKSATLKRIVQSFRGIVLLDEIHRCSDRQQEELLPLIQFGYLQLDNGERIDTGNWLTVIAATTEPDDIIPPLWDRFHIKPTFDPYTEDDMREIVLRMGERHDFEMENDFAAALGRATGGVPRNAESLVVMARDLMVKNGCYPTVDEVLQSVRVTPTGLTADHMRYLHAVQKIGQVGLDLLSAHLRLPRAVILDLERFLLEQGLISYTKQGRELTQSGYAALRDLS